YQQSSPSAGGTFATPIVGPSTLRIHTVTACTYATRDYVINGSSTAKPTALAFQTSERVALQPSAQLTLSTQGGSATGDTMSLGDADTKCQPGPVNLIVELQFQLDDVLSGVSFSTPGRISGTFTGGIKMWDVFGDGGDTHNGTYSFLLTPR